MLAQAFGPIALSPADSSWLLLSPLDRRALLRRPAATVAGLGALAGVGGRRACPGDGRAVSASRIARAPGRLAGPVRRQRRGHLSRDRVRRGPRPAPGALAHPAARVLRGRRRDRRRRRGGGRAVDRPRARDHRRVRPDVDRSARRARRRLGRARGRGRHARLAIAAALPRWRAADRLGPGGPGPAGGGVPERAVADLDRRGQPLARSAAAIAAVAQLPPAMALAWADWRRWDAAPRC